MGDLINGRTPEEIKMALELCNVPTKRKNVCESCPYTGECTPENRPDQPGWDALLYIQRLESERDAALAKVPKWISVKERLPKYVEVALVCAYRYSGGIAEPEGRIYIAMFIPSNRSWMELPDGFAVTHWMPLPSVEGLK